MTLDREPGKPFPDRAKCLRITDFGAEQLVSCLLINYSASALESSSLLINYRALGLESSGLLFISKRLAY